MLVRQLDASELLEAAALSANLARAYIIGVQDTHYIAPAGEFECVRAMQITPKT